jgi:hypothetical protein
MQVAGKQAETQGWRGCGTCGRHSVPADEARAGVGTSGTVEGAKCGRMPSAFCGGGTHGAGAPRIQPLPISAARSRELPGRPRRGGDIPVQRTRRRSLRLNGTARTRKRRAAGGGVRRLQRVHGGKGVCGRIRDTNRCGSLPRHDGSPCRATDPPVLAASHIDDEHQNATRPTRRSRRFLRVSSAPAARGLPIRHEPDHGDHPAAGRISRTASWRSGPASPDPCPGPRAT